MPICEDYLLDFDGPQKPVLEALHAFLMRVPGMSCRIRYRIPFFYQHSWVCYLNPVKGNGIELVFLYGQQLADPGGLLESRGRKQVSGIIFHHLSEVHWEGVEQLLGEALLLDEARKLQAGK